MKGRDFMEQALLSSGKTITSGRRIGENSVLRIKTRKEGVECELVITTARGEDTAYPVDVDAQSLAELDQVTLWQDKAGVEKALRALVSIGRRPSDYGLTRAELSDLVERGDVMVILARIPTGRAIGNAKVKLAPQDLGEALGALAGSSVGRAIVLSLVRGDGPTKVVCAGVPVEVHRAIAAAAEQSGTSVNQIVAEALSAHFKS